MEPKDPYRDDAYVISVKDKKGFIFDAGGEAIARIAHEDMKNFDNLGLNGFISCQLQRNAFPSSIAMTSIAKSLWNHSTDFEKMRRDLYAATFGEDAVDTLCDYFALLSKSFDIAVIRGQKPLNAPEFKAVLEASLKAMDDMKDYIEAHLNVEDPCQKDSWTYLSIHRQIYSLLGKSLIAVLMPNMKRPKNIKSSRNK